MKLKLEQRGARIELIPLIDIIFLLLVFFIYSMLSMVVYRGIPVKLPVAESVKTEKGEVLVITINERGNVFVDKESIPMHHLLSELKAVRAAFPARNIIISGHGKAHYKVFVDVLDKVRLAGFEKVSMEASLRKGAEAFNNSE